MIDPDELLEILSRIIKELRVKYSGGYVERVKISRSKYTVYVVIGDKRGKIIIDKNGSKIRVYTGLKGQEISIRRTLQREIGKYMRQRMK